MLIDVNKMRMLKVDDPNMKFKLVKQNLERFFRDYIYYYNVYDRSELVIDAGYLPYHYLDEKVLNKIIELLEKELGYSIIIMKITNTNQKGYHKGDLINIRLFDLKTATSKEVDDYFNLKIFQPLYSSLHDFNDISGKEEPVASYFSCLETSNKFLLNTENIKNNEDSNSTREV
ncbi:MAG: hypothetical protein RSB67_03690 [Clostridia bacterium]